MLNTPNLFAEAERTDAHTPRPSSAFADAQKPHLEATLPALLELIEQPDRVPSALAILNHSYASPLAAMARQRLRANPEIASLVAARYWGHWPSIEELAAMPAGSLGQAFGALLQQEGLTLIPRPEGLDQLTDDDQYLQLRTRACHDLWHLITGFPTSLPGEVALNGFGARQLRQPGPVLLLAADLLSRAHLNDTTPDLADAVSFGLRLGGVCAPVLAQRWEEGWERPLSEWRDQLGISEELRLSPFAVGPAVD
jgi:ubiquinone biosynthesis protein Coq4